MRWPSGENTALQRVLVWPCGLPRDFHAAFDLEKEGTASKNSQCCARGGYCGAARSALARHIAGKSGYLFETSTGRPLIQRNVLGRLHDAKKIGFHAFRRFRTEVLRRARAPKDLERSWLGHGTKDVTDLYAEDLKNDSAGRREWAERVGLGFSLNGLLGYKNVVQIESVKVA